MIEGALLKNSEQRRTLAWKERAVNDEVLQVILLVTRKLLSALPKNGNRMKVAFKRTCYSLGLVGKDCRKEELRTGYRRNKDGVQDSR